MRTSLLTPEQQTVCLLSLSHTSRFQLLAPLLILSACSVSAMLWSKTLCWGNSKDTNRDTAEQVLIHRTNPSLVQNDADLVKSMEIHCFTLVEGCEFRLSWQTGYQWHLCLFASSLQMILSCQESLLLSLTTVDLSHVLVGPASPPAAALHWPRSWCGYRDQRPCVWRLLWLPTNRDKGFSSGI